MMYNTWPQQAMRGEASFASLSHKPEAVEKAFQVVENVHGMAELEDGKEAFNHFCKEDMIVRDCQCPHEKCPTLDI